MDNTGVGCLKVPGFGGIPLDKELRCEDRFTHGINEWEQVPAVTMREISMVTVMNLLTDKLDWHKDVFNQEILTQWRKEAFATQPLMSEKAWAWCVEELRGKANEFNQKQYLRVLDTGSCVCKSDILVPEQLHIDLQSGIKPLLTHQHPRDDGEPVLSIVDPSLYPLVYGRSPVLMEGGQVEMPDVHGEWRLSGTATTAPKHVDQRVNSESVQAFMESNPFEPWRSGHAFGQVDDDSIEAFLWSFKYQWLPSEVEFTSESDDVWITSYINNLHPAHNMLYRGLETLISLTIKPWNDCLIKCWSANDRCQHGQVPLRIITYGVEWEDEFPEWTQAFDSVRRVRLAKYLEAKKTVKEIRQDTENGPWRMGELKEAKRNMEAYSDMKGLKPIPEPSPELWKMAQEYLQRPEFGSSEPNALPEHWKKDTLQLLRQKHQKLLHWKHPEPGTAFSYQDWRSGENNTKPVVEMASKRVRGCQCSESDGDSDHHKLYSVKLQDTFRSQGLQVIIKIDGVELTPEKPTYHGSDWQLQGQMNEHIVAVAMYIYDVNNVSESRIAF